MNAIKFSCVNKSSEFIFKNYNLMHQLISLKSIKHIGFFYFIQTHLLMDYYSITVHSYQIKYAKGIELLLEFDDINICSFSMLNQMCSFQQC